MRWLSLQLAQIYLNPAGRTYRGLDWLDRRFSPLLVSLFLLATLLPALRYGYFSAQQNQQQHQLQTLQQQLSQQRAQLAHLQRPQRQQGEIQTTFSQLHQQLKQQIAQHHGEITAIQWQFEQKPYRLLLTSQQQSEQLLPLLIALNQLDTIPFQTIEVQKLSPPRLVQLTVLFQLKTP